MRDSARMFNFELGEVEFALAAAEESDAEAGAGETYREALPDSSPRPSDQRGHMLVRVQCVFYRLDTVDVPGVASITQKSDYAEIGSP